MRIRHLFVFLILFYFPLNMYADDGYQLWMGYKTIHNVKLTNTYQYYNSKIYLDPIISDDELGSKQIQQSIQNELKLACQALISLHPVFVVDKNKAGILFILDKKQNTINEEGFIIHVNGKNQIEIIAKTNKGLLYGCFEYIRSMQMQKDLSRISITSSPSLNIRILNHWDNINRSVERGYAGISIFNWHTLPDYIDKRYVDYARANASIGINGTVITNVNANALFLTKDYLLKAKALADVFRSYGMKVYLTARFSAPIEIGHLKTADPLNEEVKKWWADKVNEIYRLIPDFGGFVVKANSEGQPGPQDYHRSHADGANMFADVLAPHHGVIIWRAFVYSHETPDDRAKQAYNEFVPLDGQFKKNVLVQIKNGPIDFQPREPFHPLFGAMPHTQEMMEFQITQEYLGQATHLVYEAPMFKEILESKINATQSVMDVLENKNNTLRGMSGVANIGNDINWCGHPFAQANWYAFGRLAWNPHYKAGDIATEWIMQTWSQEKPIVDTIKNMMLSSYENMVNYMTPLGLHHIMGNGHHYGPMPWGNTLGRADWNPVYYHRSDAFGIGFDRSITGSNAVGQYQPFVQEQWKDSSTCDEKYLLWFHHVSWQHKMKNGNRLWDALCYQYNEGVEGVIKMKQQWEHISSKIDAEQYDRVHQLLSIQQNDAIWWRDACLLYFQTFSKMPFPQNYPKAKYDLQYYQSLNFPYAPGNGK